MKRLCKCLFSVLMITCLICLSGCSKLELTEEMQTAINEYTDAVSKSSARASGTVKVVSVLDDSAIEFKTTESVIDFKYEIKDDKLIFERTDYIDDEESAKYKSDGTVVQMYDYTAESWLDKTEENKQYLSADSNPLVTLSLFRVDSDLKIRTEYLTDIKSFEKDGQKVIEFTLKDSTVSDVLDFYKADGIVRESAGHTRSYYVDNEGYISKIVVSTVQNIISNGEVGTYKTEMTVTCE